jgi:hypothetical protein
MPNHSSRKPRSDRGQRCSDQREDVVGDDHEHPFTCSRPRKQKQSDPLALWIWPNTSSTRVLRRGPRAWRYQPTKVRGARRVRFLMEPPPESDEVRTLIQLGPTDWGYVTSISDHPAPARRAPQPRKPPIDHRNLRMHNVDTMKRLA